MFAQGDLRKLKAIYGYWLPSSKFFIMFIGVVVGPLVLFVIGGHSLNILGQSGLAEYFVAIALLLLISIGVGISMFRRVTRDLSISPKYV